MRIVVTGASGQLGSYVVDGLIDMAHEVVAWSGNSIGRRGAVALRPVDLTDHSDIARALDDSNPDVVIHLAAISSVAAAHRDPTRAAAVNVAATRFVSEWTARHDRRLIYTSTDLVFDGHGSWYREVDPPHPVCVYGQTKCAGERFVLDVPRGLVARLSLLYGPSRSERIGFFDHALTALRSGSTQRFFSDEYRTPLDYATAALIIIRHVASEACGLVHVGGPERLSRFELMNRAAAVLGIDPQLVKPNLRADAAFAEPRPADLSLDSTKLLGLFPDLRLPRVEDVLSSRD